MILKASFEINEAKPDYSINGVNLKKIKFLSTYKPK